MFEREELDVNRVILSKIDGDFLAKFSPSCYNTRPSCSSHLPIIGSNMKARIGKYHQCLPAQ